MPGGLESIRPRAPADRRHGIASRSPRMLYFKPTMDITIGTRPDPATSCRHRPSCKIPRIRLRAKRGPRFAYMPVPNPAAPSTPPQLRRLKLPAQASCTMVHGLLNTGIRLGRTHNFNTAVLPGTEFAAFKVSNTTAGGPVPLGVAVRSSVPASEGRAATWLPGGNRRVR